LESLHDAIANVDIETLSDAEKTALTAKLRPVTMQMVGERLAAEFSIPSGFKYGLSKNPQYSHVPDGHYFLLGDNSGHSGDGRAFGWVPHKNLYGRAFAVVWPFDHMKDLTGFSSTWWGRLLLYGLPLAFIVHEVMRAFFLLSWRVGRDNANPELRPGERVHVNRLTYGFRIPFTRGHTVGGRDPQPGEMAAFLQKDDGERQVHLRFGRVETVTETELRMRVSETESSAVVRSDVIGRAISVWWPLSRRRSLIEPARLQPAERA
jgi:signal peptidase I